MRFIWGRECQLADIIGNDKASIVNNPRSFTEIADFDSGTLVVDLPVELITRIV